MVMQVRGDAARVVPIFAEAEEAVRIEGHLRSRAEPLFPIDVVVSSRVRARRGINRPPLAGVPVSVGSIAAVSALHGHHLADHPRLNDVVNLVPARP